ncbi:MAG: aminoglycoside phosphotransferase family protein [Crocinitomicaceae bacterium]|jgi:thiamine kinase-like enzyme|tara:strand:- start:4494 stop:5528 length:1035 start_codon:yes stop_codon:yes gene_type:complete
MKAEINEIANLFLKERGRSFLSFEQIGSGLIHSTFLVEDLKGEKYILQNINTTVFTSIDSLRGNLLTLNSFEENKTPSNTALNYLKHSGRIFLEDVHREIWRMYDFIPGLVYQTVQSINQATISANALARFHHDHIGIDLSSIESPIKDFTNFQCRIDKLTEALSKGNARRIIENTIFTEVLLAQMDCIDAFIKIEKTIPRRLIHGDPKISNFIFSEESLTIRAFIDLDTIMVGTVLYDFGDMIRSFTNKSAETDSLTTNVFNSELYDAILSSYLEAGQFFLSKEEVGLLPVGALAVCLIQAIRFYTDYLNGDVYYQIKNKDDNLIRAKNQFQLYLELKDYLDS